MTFHGASHGIDDGPLVNDDAPLAVANVSMVIGGHIVDVPVTIDEASLLIDDA